MRRYVKTRQHDLGNTMERIVAMANASVRMKEFVTWDFDEVKTNIQGTGYVRWWYILAEGDKR